MFVVAVNSLLEHLRDQSPHLSGWGFGGVGAGIALSGTLALAMPATAGWRAAWWVTAVSAGVLTVGAWSMRGTPRLTTAAASAPAPGLRERRLFAALFASYTLEGIGYIIAGTFLVASIRVNSAGWLGNGAWLFVGMAAVPSAALWAWLSSRWSHPALLTAALTLQAVGIALPVVADGPAPALIGATLFGGTFIGVSTIALAAGRLLRFPGAVALLTAGYSAGQILGPVLVSPLLHNGFRHALIAAALVVMSSAVVAASLRIGFIARGADRPAAASPARRGIPDRPSRA